MRATGPHSSGLAARVPARADLAEINHVGSRVLIWSSACRSALFAWGIGEGRTGGGAACKRLQSTTSVARASQLAAPLPQEDDPCSIFATCSNGNDSLPPRSSSFFTGSPSAFRLFSASPASYPASP